MMLAYLHFISLAWLVSRVFSCCRSCFLRFAVPVLHFPFFCPMLKQERRSKRRPQNTPYFCVFKSARTFKQKVLERETLTLFVRYVKPILRKNPTVLESKANGKYNIYFWTSCYRKNRNNAHFSFDSTMTAKNIQIAYWLHDVSCWTYQF